MNFITKSFQELTTTELYQILQLRSEVFVVEQDCVYQDIDFKDQKALHVFGVKNDKIVAYTRIFKPKDYFDAASIGRVVVQENERKFGFGHEVMKASTNAIKDHFNVDEITISAQVYLKKFYESHGFKKVGEGYLEDGIPHIRMDKK
ncbi:MULTISPECIES: GNAT family N-acetyltransferase [unclassified Polaribacter]|uniref:GNAT family N-acetyltransferase n=1 Tax=unclassified Polaribacter TaxID=196858 RepID=UPI0011BD78C6|nr:MULTISPECIES: GNAT family N-acetyltransferase [unclassified Polaribacter]TXD52773.1 GNAT family N-acetyltransferase [Polaribacter sp. IC063]TXD61650.1 GNAT family N-acetyltransferase [Polaribacter sp. IC066]